MNLGIGRLWPALLLSLLVAGCPSAPGLDDDDDDTTAASDDDDAVDDDDGSDDHLMDLGPEITCDAPTSGFVRLVEEAASRGLDVPLEWPDFPTPCSEVVGALVSTDLDADGDSDLLFHDRDKFPQVYVNDGTGHFSAHPVDIDVRGRFDRSVLAHAAGDLNGDGLPEVLVVGASFALVSWNQGDLEFSEFEVIHDDPTYPRTCINSISFGDIDADGDLDIFLPGIDPVPDAEYTTNNEIEDDNHVPDNGTAELLMLNEGGTFELAEQLTLSPDGVPGLSILGAFTDRDLDGDLDLLITSDRPFPPMPPSAFFRNDGVGSGGGPDLVNDASDVRADLRISGMGLGEADLNSDGFPDYCMTDNVPALVCMVSDGDGGYFEAGTALGLEIEGVPQKEGEPFSWTGWSIDIVDLDNDGWTDVMAAGGSHPSEEVTDAIWQGLPDRTFVEQTAALGFGDTAGHFGMAVDDFDGDGYRDIAISGWTGPARFWSNPCGADAWLEVELVGVGDNVEGFGARIEAEWGNRTDLREMHSLRTLGQSDSKIHFGLGQSDVASRLKVTWPDGEVTELRDVPARRMVTLYHPDARN